MTEMKRVYKKKSPIATSSKKKSGKKSADSRKLRRDNALKAFCIDELVSYLKLAKDGDVICPSCKKEKVLEIKKYEFKCTGCKQKGHAIKFVKLALQLTDWKAIAYIEDLARSKVGSSCSSRSTSSSESSSNVQKPLPSPTNPPSQTVVSSEKISDIKPISPPKKEIAISPTNPTFPSKKQIPKESIENLKRNVNIVEMMQRDGIKFKRAGNNLVACCPFHNDRTPSLVVTPSKNLWNCLGACGKGGSVVDYVMMRKNLLFRDAVVWLLESYADCSADVASVASNFTALREEKVVDSALLMRIVTYYHETLKSNNEALQYLRRREVYNEAMIAKFRIGYSDRTLGLNLADKRCSGGDIREQMKSLGILKSSGHEHFRGMITVPIMDKNGKVVEIYGRRVFAKSDFAKHLYLPGPHKGIFNWDCLQHREIILTESIIDALSFYQNGFTNVTASFGIQGFTAEMRAEFVSSKVEKVYIAYDNDEAGNAAARLLAIDLWRDKIRCYRVRAPKDKDINEFVQMRQPAQKHLQFVLQSAELIMVDKKDNFFPLVVTRGLKKDGEVIEKKVDQNVEKKIEQKNKVTAKKENEDVLPTNIPIKQNGDDIEIIIGKRQYRVRGLARNLTHDVMKVNMRVLCDDKYHVDTLDLFSAKSRMAYIKLAGVELGIKKDTIKWDIGKILLKLEDLQDKLIKKTLKPEQEKKVVLSAQQEKDAMAYLRAPQLLERITKDFQRCGLIGEENNLRVGYLASISRKLDDPLALIIQAASSAGKSSLMDMILNFIPKEEKVKYSSMTGQSLFYMGEQELVHKTMAISEEEGCERASYAIKVFQSEKQLCIASTGKDPKTGRLVTNEYNVNGPTQIMMTTTAIEIDDELQNRCLILTVDEERSQTKAIQDSQRHSETLAGMLMRNDKKKIIALHHNIQRMLKTVVVVNPYASDLTFLDNSPRTRRDHMKYLTLIRTSALLNQYQRPRKKVQHRGQTIEYIEATLEDIEIANKLANHVMGTSLDEVSPQTRKLLNLMWEMVQEKAKQGDLQIYECRFTQRDVREYTRWGHTQTKVHIMRLVEMEYLIVHRGRRGQRFVYELLYKGEKNKGNPFMVGLIDVKKLREKANVVGVNPKWSG